MQNLKNLSIVIPCYQSALSLPILVEQIISSMNNLLIRQIIDDYEIILVVDGSKDETPYVANSLAKTFDVVRSVILRKNYGQHNATLAGIRLSGNNFIVTMDDDLQHQPEEISKLLQPLIEGSADLIYGVADVEEHGAFRSLSSRFIKRTLKLSGVNHANYVGAFRCFRTELREGFSSFQDSSINIDVLLSWCTDSISFRRVRMNKRTHGKSGYTFAKLLRHSWNMATGYGVAPLRAATLLGLFGCVIGLLSISIIAWLYFNGSITVPGYFSLSSLIVFLSGTQLLSIGIIGEYLGRMHFRSLGKPSYLIKSDIQISEI